MITRNIQLILVTRIISIGAGTFYASRGNVSKLKAIEITMCDGFDHMNDYYDMRTGSKLLNVKTSNNSSIVQLQRCL